MLFLLSLTSFAGHIFVSLGIEIFFLTHVLTLPELCVRGKCFAAQSPGGMNRAVAKGGEGLENGRGEPAYTG